MGICYEAVKAISFMKRQGLLDGVRSMVELGNQHVRYNRPEVVRLLERHGIPVDSSQTTASFYRSWGIEDYTSIDLNGKDGAIAHDLNTPFTEDGSYGRTFDLTTNLGTTEHCFDQCMAFRNIHNLTRTEGLMLHVLPAFGWDGHCFFRYDKNFFLDLACECRYEVLSLGYYMRPLSFGRYLRMIARNFPSARQPVEIGGFDDSYSRNGVVVAVLRKTHEAFSCPIQGMYKGLRNAVPACG